MNTILQKRIEEVAIKVSDVCEPCDYGDPFCASCHRPYMYDAAKKMGEVILNNQWISVEEALPECDKCHLAMYEDGGIIVAKYENGTWWWQDGFVVGRNTDGDLMYSSSCKVPSGLITHWMSIPQIGGEE